MSESNESSNPGDGTSAGEKRNGVASRRHPEEGQSVLWLGVVDRVFVTVLVIAFLSLITVHWLRLSRWGLADVEITSQQPRETHYSLDINSASWVEWAQLEGIGEKLAKRIVSDREERGLFQNPDEVRRVNGVTPRIFESIKLCLHGGTDVAP